MPANEGSLRLSRQALLLSGIRRTDESKRGVTRVVVVGTADSSVAGGLDLGSSVTWAGSG